MKTEDVRADFEGWLNAQADSETGEIVSIKTNETPREYTLRIIYWAFCGGYQSYQQLNDKVIAAKDAEIARLQNSLIDIIKEEHYFNDLKNRRVVNELLIRIRNIATKTLEKNNENGR